MSSSNRFIDPAILDGALVACGSDAWLYYGFTPELPHSFDEIIVGRMPTPREACTAGFKCCTTFKEDTTTYDLVHTNTKGSAEIASKLYQFLSSKLP